MKRFNRLFQEAERLAPPPDLWKRIEAKSDLAAGGAGKSGSREPAAYREAPASRAALRAAAAVVLAVGVLGLGVMLQKRTGGSNAYANSTATQEVAPAESDREPEMVDPELLGWHADLGELNDEVVEAEEAEEML